MVELAATFLCFVLLLWAAMSTLRDRSRPSAGAGFGCGFIVALIVLVVLVGVMLFASGVDLAVRSC